MGLEAGMTDDEIKSKIKVIAAFYTELRVADIGDEVDLVTIVDWTAYHHDQQAWHIVEDFLTEFQISVPGRDFSDWADSKHVSGLLKVALYFPYIFFVKKQIVVDHISVKNMVDIAKCGVWYPKFEGE